MANQLAQLLAEMRADDWRDDVGFSPELETVHQRVFAGSIDQSETIAALDDWTSKHQPCLFGRMAAKCGFLSYCVLTEDDLSRGDEVVRDKIQDARSAWTREAFHGRKNGFIIALISPRLATAVPDESVKKLALRLASLYLLTDVVPDEIFLDRIWLEKPGPAQTTWEWGAGVNYFCAQGDKRWWQDHRFPAGMAFSINSVGHMVKSGLLARAMQELNDLLAASDEDWSSMKLDSLDKALVLAMKTIANASSTTAGPATELLAIPKSTSGRRDIPCPADLPASLAAKDHCQYLGHYHTDYTVPSEYFRRDTVRPEGLSTHVLDFTYLFYQHVENPDYETMGAGRQIRESRAARPSTSFAHRFLKAIPREVMLEQCDRLRRIGQCNDLNQS
jgi:hypothetical protein